MYRLASRAPSKGGLQLGVVRIEHQGGVVDLDGSFVVAAFVDPLLGENDVLVALHRQQRQLPLGRRLTFDHRIGIQKTDQTPGVLLCQVCDFLVELCQACRRVLDRLADLTFDLFRRFTLQPLPQSPPPPR